MDRFDPEEIVAWTGGVWQNAKMPDSITGFCFDARTIKPGECFVALSCGARDGHEFIQQALDSGAGSILLERPQTALLPQIVVDDSLVAMGAIASGVRRQFAGPVVGVTGSCGKTSTKEMLRLLLGEGQTHATPGNWNNLIGVPMTLFGLDNNQHEFAVVEAGINQPGEMSELGAMIHADLTIVTNIGPAHLELLGTFENIAAEKSLLTRHSKADAPLVLPSSAAGYPAFLDYADKTVVLAAEGEAIPVKPKQIVHYNLKASGSSTSIVSLREGTAVEDFEIHSPSQGICTNAALVITVARHFGISDAEIKKRLQEWSPASKRGRIEKYGKQTIYIDCYNANPASMGDAIAAFCRSTPSDEPRCYVLGAMNELGEDAVDMHREIGRKLELHNDDRAFFVGPEMLTRAYAEGVTETGIDPKNIESVPDSKSIQSVVANFSGSIFLKGSRSYQLEKILPDELKQK